MSLFSLSGLEGERPARLTRGEADRDTYRRSAVPRECPSRAWGSIRPTFLFVQRLFGRTVFSSGLLLRGEGET